MVCDEVLHLEVAGRVAALVDPPGLVRARPAVVAAFRPAPLPPGEEPPDFGRQAAVVEVGRRRARGRAVGIWNWEAEYAED